MLLRSNGPPRRWLRTALTFAVVVAALSCGGDSSTAPPPPKTGVISVRLSVVQLYGDTFDTVFATVTATATESATLSLLTLTSSGAAAAVDSLVIASGQGATLTRRYVIPPLATPDTLVLSARAQGSVAAAEYSSITPIEASPIYVIPTAANSPATPRVGQQYTTHVVVTSPYPVDSVIWFTTPNGDLQRASAGGSRNFAVDFTEVLPYCSTGQLQVVVYVYAAGSHQFARAFGGKCWVPPGSQIFTRGVDANPYLLPGDTIRVTANSYVQAGDEAPITWTGYAAGPPVNRRDSVAGSGNSTFPIEVSAAWFNGSSLALDSTVSVAAFTRDSAGYLISSGAVGVKVVDAVRRPTASLPLTTAVVDVAYDAKRNRILLSEPDARRIAVIDVATWTALSPILVLGRPAGFDLVPGGDTLVVVHDGTWDVEVIPLNGGFHPTITVAGPAGHWLRHLRIMANGKAFVTSTYGGYGDGAVYELDLAALTSHQRTDAGLAGDVTESGALARSADAQKLFVLAQDGCCPMRGQIYMASSDAFGANQNAGGAGDYAVQISLSGNGAVAGIGNHVWTGDLTVSGAHFMAAQFGVTPWYAPPTAVSNDGSQFYQGWPVGFFRLRVSDGALLETVRLPVAYTPALYSSANRILALPDGHTVVFLTDSAAFRVTLP